MICNKVKPVNCILTALAACFLLMAPSGDAMALVTGQLSGEVKDADGNPVGGFTLEFVPTENSPNAVARKLKVKKNGTFKMPFFPTGEYRAKSTDPEIFVKLQKMVQRDPTNLEVDSHEGGAHPEQGLPPFRVTGGMKTHLELTVTSAEEQKKMAREFSLQQASGDLKSILKLFETREYDRALEQVDKLLEKKPDLGTAHYLRAETLFRMDRYDEANSAYRKALELDTEQTGVHGGLGLSLLRLGEKTAESGNEDAAAGMFAESVEQFDLALQETPGNLPVMTSRAAALDRLGDQERFIASLRGILEVDPGNVTIRLRLADMLTRSGQGDQALEVLNSLESTDPEVANVLFNVAVRFYNDGQLDTAVLAVDKAIQINPELAAAYRLLGRSKMSKGEKEAAIAALERFLELAPDDPQAEVERKLIEALKAQ